VTQIKVAKKTGKANCPNGVENDGSARKPPNLYLASCDLDL